MKIEITGKGIYGAPTKDNKTGEVPVGTVLTVKKEPTGWDGRYRVISEDGKGDGKKVAVINPADAKGPFEAKEKGGGWWAITDADGNAVGKSIKKDDAEIFNALSDEDKAAHVANLKAE